MLRHLDTIETASLALMTAGAGFALALVSGLLG